MSIKYEYKAHLTDMTPDKLIKEIKETHFRDICDVLQKFDLSGSDIIDLQEHTIREKMGPHLNEASLQRFLTFVNAIQVDPHSVLYYQVNEMEIEPMESSRNSSSQNNRVSDPSPSPGYETAPVFNYDNPQARPTAYSDLPKCVLRVPPFPEEDIYLTPVQAKVTGKALIESHQFFRRVNRTVGRSILENSREGTFLLRPSGESNHLAVLMINSRKIQNVPIWFNKNSEQFYLDTSNDFGPPTMFKSIDEMLCYYTKNAINDVKLISNNRLPELLGNTKK